MSKRILTFTLCAAFGFTAGFLRGEERFDYKVREMIFAGFNGNQEMFEKGMALLDATLQENPKHAEALVWRGAGLFFRSGQLFRQGDQQKGMELYTKGIAEMDQAVELEPNNLGVRIPRAAVLLSAAASMGENPMARTFAAKALGDYEKTYREQEKVLDQLGLHPRGELLQGLAVAYKLTGNLDKSKEFYARIERDLPETAYAKRAIKFRETGSLTSREMGCIGCHVKK